MAQREKAINGVILRMRQTLNLDSIFNVTITELRQAVKCDRLLNIPLQVQTRLNWGISFRVC
ncbi:hypothetical protein [Trichormus azollae]|uniref:hypothetical protein n=1 Tax=Trichormus azollae TaxID=1164 RepID=UPI00325FC9DE